MHFVPWGQIKMADKLVHFGSYFVTCLIGAWFLWRAVYGLFEIEGHKLLEGFVLLFIGLSLFISGGYLATRWLIEMFCL
jgi:hypothetical protein